MAMSSRSSRRQAFADRGDHPAKAILAKGGEVGAGEGGREPAATAAPRPSATAKPKNMGLRVDPALHRALTIAALDAGVSLNDYCEAALRRAVGEGDT